MRKLALLSTILLVGLVAGCKAESPSPTPTIAPTDTDTPETPAVVSPSGPATCVVAPPQHPADFGGGSRSRVGGRSHHLYRVR